MFLGTEGNAPYQPALDDYYLMGTTTYWIQLAGAGVGPLFMLIDSFIGHTGSLKAFELVVSLLHIGAYVTLSVFIALEAPMLDAWYEQEAALLGDGEAPEEEGEGEEEGEAEE
jgi:hypothetical protein